MLYKSHANILGPQTLIPWVLILGWCPPAALGVEVTPAQLPPCSCIIRAELKMAAGIWFPSLHFVSLGSTAASRTAVGCKWGRDNGFNYIAPGVTTEKDQLFFPLHLN